MSVVALLSALRNMGGEGIGNVEHGFVERKIMHHRLSIINDVGRVGERGSPLPLLFARLRYVTRYGHLTPFCA